MNVMPRIPRMTGPACRVGRALWRGAPASGGPSGGERSIPEEVAVALTYDFSSHAVMMATPLDLEDFAVGFSLSEGIVTAAEQIEDIEIVPGALGIDLRISLAKPQREGFARRRRRLAGPTGCGLCGVENLMQAMRPIRRVTREGRVSPQAIIDAVAALPAHQRLHGETRAVHAAALWRRGGGFLAVREDVGRHNALDKLAGALARAGRSAGDGAGIVVLTSRVSVEMVQKTAIMGAPIIVAVSAPTALAVRCCDAAGITLVAIARDDSFEVFSRAERIVPQADAAAAAGLNGFRTRSGAARSAGVAATRRARRSSAMRVP